MELLDKLSSTNSRVLKESMLRNISPEELKVFKYALDPYKMYGLSNFEFMPDFVGEPSNEMFELLDKLASRHITGNEARNKVMEFAQLNGNLIQQICRKKLLCGVQAKTVNKVHKNAIPMFEVQLAKELKPHELQKLNYEKLMVQLKFDGVRLITIIDIDGNVELRTRNGKLVNCPELEKEMSKFTGMVFDGEIIAGDGKVSDRTNVSGQVNSAIHGGTLLMKNLTYHLFDVLTLSSWKNTISSVRYIKRYGALEQLVNTMSGPIQLAKTYWVDDYDMLMHNFYTMIAIGYEGLILKDEDHRYTFKRSKDWVKLKEIKDLELTCTDIIPGKDKYKGMIGALECKGIVEGRQVIVNVGSGLSDIQRNLGKGYFLLKQINIQYNSVIQDSKTGKWSLFLPRFVEVREDV